MITTLIELFTFGSSAFWFSIITFVTLLTIFSDKNYHFWKLVFTGGIILLFLPQLKTLSVANIVSLVIAYFVCGIGYSLIRWFRYTSNTVGDYIELLKKLNIRTLNEANAKLTPIENEIEAVRIKENPKYDDNNPIYIKYKNLINDATQLEHFIKAVSPTNNKSKIYNWTLHWPWSILKLLTADLGEFLYELVKKQYVQIVNHIMSQAIK